MITQSRLMLQFGHGVEAVDDPEYRTNYIPHRRCFNSATALKPWMMREWTRYQTEGYELQFGHGVEAVDEAAASATASGQNQLQFGHGVEAVDDTVISVPITVAVWLQFGHGVEPWMKPACCQAIGSTAASIRPRR